MDSLVEQVGYCKVKSIVSWISNFHLFSAFNWRHFTTIYLSSINWTCIWWNYSQSLVPNCSSKLLKDSQFRKKEQIPQNAFTLPWEPVHQQLKRVFDPKIKDRPSPGVTKQLLSIVKLAQSAKRYFSPTATLEILETCLPYINVNRLSRTVTEISMMALLLPTEVPPAPLKTMNETDTPLPPFYWVPGLFQIWLLIVNVPTVDSLFLDLFSRLAEDQVATPQNTGFTETQVRWIASVGLRSMDLPVGSGASGMETAPIRGRSGGGSSGNAISSGFSSDFASSFCKSRIEALARFFIYTLAPGSTLNTLDHLLNLLQAIESFFHPSNAGKWSYSICRFLQNLSTEYLRRLRLGNSFCSLSFSEQKEDCKTPMELRLDGDIKNSFVSALKPLAFMGMFGKEPMSVMAIHGTLKNLAWIAPDLVLPGLLDRIYPSLESLTEVYSAL